MESKKKIALSCAVVQDLLPSYVDGLTSGETNMAIEAHLKKCPACRSAYEAMTGQGRDEQILVEESSPEPGVGALRKVRRKQGIKLMAVVLAAVLVCLGVFAGYLSLLANMKYTLEAEAVQVENVYLLEDGRLFFELHIVGKNAIWGPMETVTEYTGGNTEGARQRLLTLRYGRTGHVTPAEGNEVLHRNLYTCFLDGSFDAIYYTDTKNPPLPIWREGDVLDAAPPEIEALVRRIGMEGEDSAIMMG